MIVNQTAQGWQIIYHRAHALLAAQVAAQWRGAARTERIAETIAAIAQHDDLEREWEGDHLSEGGAPLDFTLGEKQLDFTEPWQRLITDALYRGRWVALLTAMHVNFLNSNKRGESKKLDAFLDKVQGQIAEWRESIGISPEQAQAAYAFLQWCDRLSLILCKHELPSRERWLEISDGPDGVRYDVLQREDGSVTVQPWPFRDERFSLSVDSYCLEQLTFKNNDELVKALKKAPFEELRWEFVKGDVKRET
ncbi:MAG: DUF3891 family protein [Chloroflexaceae bacterium]|jgi:hypothetical protein|nr:DUF3891 family protein [Chloroflexaceae bacterium]